MDTVTLKTSFQVADFFVELIHGGDSLASDLLEELSAVDSANSPVEPVCARVELIRSNSELEIPSRSRLVFASGKQRTFVLGNDRYYVEADTFTAALCFSEDRLTVQYRECAPAVFSASRAFLKWLCIKSAERRGMLCLHASAVCYRGGTIVFCGHSGTGKSSATWRLQRHGATVISDDVALIRNGECFSIGWKTHVVGDFTERFGLPVCSEAYLRNPAQVQNVTFSNINLLVFPQVWESEESRWETVDLDSALSILWETYEREAGWNAYLGDKNLFLKQSRDAFADSRICLFFAGRDESAARASLIGMIESDSTQ